MAIERPEETLTRLWDAKHPLVNQLEKLIQLERSEQPSKYGFVEQAAGKSLSKSFARSGILSGGES
ncbi:MAG TPA: hypothetical protein VJK52_05780, partial [Candidatus Nanoarchaeia archaeon]|nr:hypothetical protein [Candidatus Nanoarchaeia archaeon]